MFLTIQFPALENLEAFMAHPKFAAGKYFGVAFEFDESEAWKNQLVMKFEEKGDHIVAGIKNIAGDFTASKIIIGKVESDIAGYNTGTEFNEEDQGLLPKIPQTMQPAKKAVAKTLRQDNLPAINHNAAQTLKSCFQDAMTETSANMDISDIDPEKNTFSIIYTRGNCRNTNNDIESAIHSLKNIIERSSNSSERGL